MLKQTNKHTRPVGANKVYISDTPTTIRNLDQFSINLAFTVLGCLHTISWEKEFYVVIQSSGSISICTHVSTIVCMKS